MRGKHGTGDYMTGCLIPNLFYYFFMWSAMWAFSVIKNVSQNDEEWSCLVSIQLKKIKNTAYMGQGYYSVLKQKTWKRFVF